MIKLKDLIFEKKVKPMQKISKKEWSKIKKFNKHIGQDGTHYVTQLDKRLGTILVPVIVEGKLTEKFDIKTPGYSSGEAKTVVDGALKQYSKDLRKLQGRVVKDWMSKAKSGVIDYFDLVRGFQQGDAKRAYPYETEFLMNVLSKDKIIDRFRKYFGGKKGKRIRWLN